MTMKRWPSTARMGFTLVELLVVIAIIGILIAITIPAVQMARESARRTSCMNNLKELARATIAFESSNRKYPSAFSDWPRNGAQVQLHPWMVSLLPELDQQNLYQDIQATGLIDSVQVGYVEVLNCPTSPLASGEGPEFSYAANMGFPDQVAAGMGPLDVFGTGIFYDRSRRGVDRDPVVEMTAVKVKDGLPHTILFGENRNISDSRAYWNLTNTVSSAMYTSGNATTGHPEFAFGIVWMTASPQINVFGTNKQVRFGDVANPWVLARPASWHNNSFNLSFADGRVETLNVELDYAIYARLMTPDGARSRMNLQSVLGADGTIGDGRIDESIFN